MLMYHMRNELDAERDRREDDFKSMIFANNPEMYESLYLKEPEDEIVETDMYIPQSEEEMDAFLRKMERMGAFDD